MHPNVTAVQDALESADARDGSGDVIFVYQGEGEPPPLPRYPEADELMESDEGIVRAVGGGVPQPSNYFARLDQALLYAWPRSLSCRPIPRRMAGDSRIEHPVRRALCAPDGPHLLGRADIGSHNDMRGPSLGRRANTRRPPS